MTTETAFKILNVDDYRAALYSRSKILRQAGYEVAEAMTGRQALETVRRERPQLVLLDVNLPDITGFEVCKQIKGDPDLAVIQVVPLFQRWHWVSSFSLTSTVASLATLGIVALFEWLWPASSLSTAAATGSSSGTPWSRRPNRRDG